VPEVEIVSPDGDVVRMHSSEVPNLLRRLRQQPGSAALSMHFQLRYHVLWERPGQLWVAQMDFEALQRALAAVDESR
jgi:hypothetical protein